VRGITIIKDSNRIHTGDDLDLVQEVKEYIKGITRGSFFFNKTR
jgi:hypothetical protein